MLADLGVLHRCKGAGERASDRDRGEAAERVKREEDKGEGRKDGGVIGGLPVGGECVHERESVKRREEGRVDDAHETGEGG